jgi:hypothetical protein
VKTPSSRPPPTPWHNILLRWFGEFNVLGNNQDCRGDSGGTPTQQIYTDFIGAWRHV